MIQSDCNIAMASDDGYSVHLCALLYSILENRKDTYRKFNFFILDNDISKKNKKLCKSIIDTYPNCEIEFHNIAESIQRYASMCHMHLTVNVFSRLYLAELLPGIDKIIYIDVDTCVLTDISKLFDLNIENYYAGVVYDYIMSAFVNKRVRAPRKFRSVSSGAYILRYLNLPINPTKYFQAGVLLLNLNKIKSDNAFEQAKSLLSKRHYWFLEQDTLNIVFRDNILFLDPRWNVVNVENDIIDALYEPQKSQFVFSQSDPYIVHFAGDKTKPWSNTNAKYSEYYFKYRELIKL